MMKISKREYRYIQTERLIKLASKLTGCIQFPHFGAHYPDAACIDGYLWDLDSGDGDMLSSGGDDPCPCCNTKYYLSQMTDNEVGTGRMVAHINYIFNRYGTSKPLNNDTPTSTNN